MEGRSGVNEEEEEARRTSVRTKRLTKEGTIVVPCVDSKKTPASIPSPSNWVRESERRFVGNKMQSGLPSGRTVRLAIGWGRETGWRLGCCRCGCTSLRRALAGFRR